MRSKRLTDREFFTMIELEYMQTEDRVDKALKNLLDSEYFQLLMQLRPKESGISCGERREYGDKECEN